MPWSSTNKILTSFVELTRKRGSTGTWLELSCISQFQALPSTPPPPPGIRPKVWLWGRDLKICRGLHGMVKLCRLNLQDTHSVPGSKSGKWGLFCFHRSGPQIYWKNRLSGCHLPGALLWLINGGGRGRVGGNYPLTFLAPNYTKYFPQKPLMVVEHPLPILIKNFQSLFNFSKILAQIHRKEVFSHLVSPLECKIDWSSSRKLLN